MNPLATLLPQRPPQNPDLQAKTYRGTNLRNQLWCPIRTFRAHEGSFNGAHIPMRRCEIPERFKFTQTCHPIGAHQGFSLGRHPENTDFGPIQEPGGKIRPPNPNRETTLNPHKLRVGVKRCGRIRAQEERNGQAVVNRGHFGMG